MLKQYLQFKLSQKLSPQQIQLMKLIQLPTLAFEQRIKQELEENPALESGKDNEDNFEDNFGPYPAYSKYKKKLPETFTGKFHQNLLNMKALESFNKSTSTIKEPKGP